MTFVQIVDMFTYYGVDVVVLAALTCAITQVLKTTLLKNAQKKLYTFLPYIIGIVLYAAYAAASRPDIGYLAANFAAIANKGISVGALATIVYVAYGHLAKGGPQAQKTEIICLLLTGYIGEDIKEKAAAEIAAALQQCAVETGAEQTAGIIAAYSGGDMSQKEIEILSNLIVKTVERMA